LPDIDQGGIDSSSNHSSDAAVRNSPKTKIMTVAFLVVILAGAGLAMKFTLFAPKSATKSQATETKTATRSDAATLADIPVSDAPATLSLQMPAATSNPPAHHLPPVEDTDDVRLVQIEDAFAEAQIAWQHQHEALSNEIRSRTANIDAAITALSSKIDTVNRADPSDALTTINARLQRLETRLAHLDRRSRENRKQLHGEVGARRHGASLPFRVESIDWWDGAPSVVVRLGEHKQFVTIGETLEGWRLVSASPASGQARFNRNGRDAMVEAGP